MSDDRLTIRNKHQQQEGNKAQIKTYERSAALSDMIPERITILKRSKITSPKLCNCEWFSFVQAL